MTVSEVMAYTALADPYWDDAYGHTKVMLTDDINYSCHIKAIELIQPIIWGLYHTTLRH